MGDDDGCDVTLDVLCDMMFVSFVGLDHAHDVSIAIVDLVRAPGTCMCLFV